MNSAAYGAQPDFSKAVLFAVACRYHGRNNGDLSLPYSEARKLGIAHQWKLYAGLQLLRKADLILCTRQGKLERGTKVCSLYALTWRGIDKAPDGVTYDAGINAIPLPGNDWANWGMPENWAQIIREVTNANHGQKKDSRLIESRREINPVSTTVGNGRSTTVGATMPNIAQPPWGKEAAFIAPTVVDTSKTLGGGTRRKRISGARSPQSASDPSPSSTPIDRAQKLLAKLPHLTDVDIAKAARVELADAKAARDVHGRGN